MNLQFGCKKCDKLHIGKSQYDGISPTVTIDSGKEDIFKEQGGAKKPKDIVHGKEIMNELQAAKLMREAILLGGLPTKSESWINITQKDLPDLEKPDLTLEKNLVSLSENPSK